MDLLRIWRNFSFEVKQQMRFLYRKKKMKNKQNKNKVFQIGIKKSQIKKFKAIKQHFKFRALIFYRNLYKQIKINQKRYLQKQKKYYLLLTSVSIYQIYCYLDSSQNRLIMSNIQVNDSLLLNSFSSLMLQQQILQPQIKLTHVMSNHYFLLINKKFNKALLYDQPHRYTQQHGKLAEINQSDIRQIFQIQEIKDGKFQIVHGTSTLVFTRKEGEVMLDFGNWKQSQFFYPQKIYSENPKQLFYHIRQNKKSNKYLYYDGFALRCQNTVPQDDRAVWEIKLCLHNSTLNRSCWIEYAFSNQVIDIPGATDKPNTQVIQYPCNYRFNQRFFIQRVTDLPNISSESKQKLFTIKSLKTSLYLTVNESPFSITVVQDNRKSSQKNLYRQLWVIEYTGNGLYIIKSALRPKMYLAVRQRSSKIQQPLVITDNQDFCLWKIIGNFNIMPNKDAKF